MGVIFHFSLSHNTDQTMNSYKGNSIQYSNIVLTVYFTLLWREFHLSEKQFVKGVHYSYFCTFLAALNDIIGSCSITHF